MGSLMPGWASNAPGLPPKELREAAREADGEGYFAKLEKSRTMRHDAAGALDQDSCMTLHTAGSLSRTTSEHMPELAASPTAMSARRTFETCSTLPSKYRGTDWGSELRSLRVGQRAGLGRMSADNARTYMGGTSSKGSSHSGTPSAWWAQLESSSFNQAALEEENSPRRPHALGRQGSVKLDFKLTGTNLR